MNATCPALHRLRGAMGTHDKGPRTGQPIEPGHRFTDIYGYRTNHCAPGAIARHIYVRGKRRAYTVVSELIRVEHSHADWIANYRREHRNE